MNMRGVFARVSVGTIRLWVGAAVLILVVADISPAGAQSTEILRLSTLDETTSNPVGVSGGQQYAQSFCTGESEVTLSKVRLPTSSSSDSEPSVTIRAGGSGGPGETIDTLTNPETFDNSISTYEDFTSSGIELDANTSYWLVIHVGDGSDPLTFGVTESKLESSAEAGWSIGDKMLYQGSGGWSPAFASSEPSGYRMRMAVYARGAVPSMAPPIFTDRDCNGVADPLTLRVDENTAASTVVGPVTATDPDNDSLTYSVSGTDAAEFNQVFVINNGSGEITVKSGASPNYESKRSYSITVNVTDGKDASGNMEDPAVTDDSVTVTVRVNNIDEPGTVTLSQATPGVGSALRPTLDDPDGWVVLFKVQWSRADTADGAFTVLNFRYISSLRKASYTPGTADEGKFLKVTLFYIDRQCRVVNSYNNQCRRMAAKTADNAVATAGTNNAPVFSSSNVSRSIAENTAAGQNVGAVVTATDADAGDTLGYTLGGADAASFDFVESSGQIRTKSGVTYDFEAKSSYTVTVTASDGTATAAATVTIGVTDVDEPPSAPATPMVSAVSGSTTSLSVSWAAPANAGKPAIANYDVQYRAGSSGAWSDGPEDVAGTSATITSLVASTDYEARVRATNAEGDSGMVRPARGRPDQHAAAPRVRFPGRQLRAARDRRRGDYARARYRGRLHGRGPGRRVAQHRIPAVCNTARHRQRPARHRQRPAPIGNALPRERAAHPGDHGHPGGYAQRRAGVVETVGHGADRSVHRAGRHPPRCGHHVPGGADGRGFRPCRIHHLPGRRRRRRVRLDH